MKHSTSWGGSQLRALREALGKTQLEVELDADLGSGYLQRVESGKVKHPERLTVERILAALSARYAQRRDILEYYGYIVETPLPTTDESEWAAGLCRDVLNGVPFPAYLLDCAHRLIEWNAFTPKLFGLTSRLGGMSRLAGTSMVKALFDSASGIANLIHNPGEFYPATLRAFRYEMRLSQGEAWHQDVMDDLLAVPRFREYWDRIEQDGLAAAPARPLTPIEFKLPGIGVLKFRLTSEILSEDRRFRIIYYLPADSATLDQCAVWSREV